MVSPLIRASALLLATVCASCATAPPEAPVSSPPVSEAPPPPEAPIAEAPPPVADVPAQAPIPEAPPAPVDPFCAQVVELNAVYFDAQSAVLTNAARIRLDENVEVLARCPLIVVTINGYAFVHETSVDALSQARADAVGAYFSRMGVDAERLRAVGRAVDPSPGRPKGTTVDEWIRNDDGRSRRADPIPSDSFR